MIRLAIADDHQSIIDGIKLLLQNETDIEFVGTANDGKGLVELIKHKKPHIVITDIRMPNMNGIELTRFIKANYPGVKIIAFSMFDQDDAIQQMLEAGVSGYILKNSTLQEVLKAVQQVYLGETYFDPQINVEDNSSAKHKKTLLTNRQYEILKLIGEGKTTSEIAEELFIGVHTVSTHRKNMARILGLKGKGELLRYAMEKKYDF
jgi:two-component system nitrate/nitrite response regulator NarL